MLKSNRQQSTAAMRPCNTTAGFTLIEVLVAMTIFAIGFLAVAALQTRAVIGNTTGRLSMDAAAWTASQFEQFVGQAFDNPNFIDTNGDGTAGLDADSAATADFTLASPDGRNTTLYWNVADNPRGFKQVRVITTWDPVGASPKRAAFDFIKQED
ncbi:hypothetical protein DESC_120043 [Desulfosarcina cetonica]|uniref:type IV pilus modification PilV family protein n=1 Tax=Desulfosarcina cetonica TaxID=90730 RepID=UPI0006CF3875|nr:prepilin-type N-terminal cleavage/methylation domain-containing protein [Desulfosarcina cetonica]VTR63951.1 hypothetical protein DESC_120043 [Desulfosarcina cetonica]